LVSSDVAVRARGGANGSDQGVSGGPDAGDAIVGTSDDGRRVGEWEGRECTLGDEIGEDDNRARSGNGARVVIEDVLGLIRQNEWGCLWARLLS
jgi:hypothetical protein